MNDAQPAATNVEAQAADRRYKKLKHDQTGQEVNRIDFIRECWTKRKMARGAIAKLVSQLSGEKVPYQIVFSATKKLAGGPDKTAEAAPAASAESTEDTSASA